MFILVRKTFLGGWYLCLVFDYLCTESSEDIYVLCFYVF